MDMDAFTGITKALSDSHRVRALKALRRGELCACQIIELLRLAPSTVSKHMSVLKQAGLVESRKDSRWVYYRLAEDSKCGKETRKIINLCSSLLERDATAINDNKIITNLMKLGLENLCKRRKG